MYFVMQLDYILNGWSSGTDIKLAPNDTNTKSTTGQI
jgi:hypothetical protein